MTMQIIATVYDDGYDDQKKHLSIAREKVYPRTIPPDHNDLGAFINRFKRPRVDRL